LQLRYHFGAFLHDFVRARRQLLLTRSSFVLT